MNLLVFITTLILGNTTTKFDLKIQQETLVQVNLPENNNWLEDQQELRFQERWQQYKFKYHKYYRNYEEEYRRKGIFIKNSELIQAHNQLYNEGLSTYELGHNQFSDLTHEEFLNQYTTLDESTRISKETAEPTMRYDPTDQYEYGLTLPYGLIVQNDPTVQQDTTVRNGPTARHDTTVRNGPTARHGPTVKKQCITLPYGPTVQNGHTVRHDTTVRNGPTIRHDTTVRNGPRVRDDTTVRNGPTIRHDTTVRNGPTIRHDTTVQNGPTVAHEPTVQEQGLTLPDGPTVQSGPTIRHDTTVRNGPIVRHDTTVRNGPTIRHDTTVRNGPRVHDDTTVRNGPTIRHDTTVRNGPTIRHDTTVRNGPRVRDDTTVRNGPTIRHDTTVRNGPTIRHDTTVRNGPRVRDDTTVRNGPTIRHDTTVRNGPTIRHDTTVRNGPRVRDDTTVRNGPTVQYEDAVRYEDYDAAIESPKNSLDNDYVEYMPPANVDLPVTVDWRRAGAVTRVKNQGKCKASWLFSATGALEGQVFRKTRNLTVLSEQNILDCSEKHGYKACKNGSVLASFQYIMHNQGIDTDATYPWEEKQSWFCHYKNLSSNPIIRSIEKITSGDEFALQAAVATVGPISVGFDASNKDFQFYKNGLYRDPNCTTSNLNHNMLIVGYRQNYYVVKNSFGHDWGRFGYIFIPKGTRNACGIATRAMYPKL